MAQRYFKPDLKKIEALRIKHGLTVDTFAEKAGIDRRTLARLMRKGGVVMSTMCSIAELFHVSVDTLLPGYSETPEPSEPRVTVRVEMELPVTFFTSAETMQFKDLLIAVLQSTDKINVTSVAEGCTVVTLDMSQRDAVRLIHLALTPEDTSVPRSESDKWYIIEEIHRDLRHRGAIRQRIQRSARVWSEELITTLLSAARAFVEFFPGNQVTLSFQIEEHAKQLQKHSELKRDLRKYNILTITLVLPLDANATHEYKRGQKAPRTRKK